MLAALTAMLISTGCASSSASRTAVLPRELPARPDFMAPGPQVLPRAGEARPAFADRCVVAADGLNGRLAASAGWYDRLSETYRQQ